MFSFTRSPIMGPTPPTFPQAPQDHFAIIQGVDEIILGVDEIILGRMISASILGVGARTVPLGGRVTKGPVNKGVL